MQFNVDVSIGLFFLTLLLSIEAGIYLLLQYKTSLARWAGLMVLCQAFELGSYLIHLTGLGVGSTSYIDLLQILAYSLFCCLWFLFVVKLVRMPRLMGIPVLVTLFVPPAVYIAMMFSMIAGGDLGQPFGGVLMGSIPLSPLMRGLPRILFLLSTYGIAIVSSLLVLDLCSRTSKPLRKTLLPLLAGPILLGLAGLLELAGFAPLRPISLHQAAIASISLLAFFIVIDLRSKGILAPAHETVVQQIPDGVVTLDMQDRIVDLNPAAQRILGSSRNVSVHRKLARVWPEGEILLGGSCGAASKHEEMTIRPGLVDTEFEIVATQLKDSFLEPVGKVILLHDITERKRRERMIEALLAEKELILREMHHRIRNNMSTVCSLLSLQAQSLKEPSAVAALEDARDRVTGMLLLYDKIYSTEGFGDISVANFLPNLVDEIFSSFPPGKSILVEKHIEDFVLDFKRLQSVGIIVYELLTNVMKYAFEGRSEGRIAVETSLRDGQISIEVWDNGRGMPEGFDIGNSPGFGYFLLRGLAEQLKGTIRLEKGSGTRVIVEFRI